MPNILLLITKYRLTNKTQPTILAAVKIVNPDNNNKNKVSICNLFKINNKNFKDILDKKQKKSNKKRFLLIKENAKKINLFLNDLYNKKCLKFQSTKKLDKGRCCAVFFRRRVQQKVHEEKRLLNTLISDRYKNAENESNNKILGWRKRSVHRGT